MEAKPHKYACRNFIMQMFSDGVNIITGNYLPDKEWTEVAHVHYKFVATMEEFSSTELNISSFQLDASIWFSEQR